jgi:glycosyltransferase involved in cell wall biosynthesis
VGRDYYRKGVDIAIETVDELNNQGLFAKLTVCGVKGKNRKNVRFVGPYQKKDAIQLKRYVELYRRAHILLHPARFEPAGIVPSEAAAFATPTITNDTGGLATTVKDGVSGIVLPKHSLAEDYVRVIKSLIKDPDRYYALCESSRKRYEKELNWKCAGDKVASILYSVIDE